MPFLPLTYVMMAMFLGLSSGNFVVDIWTNFLIENEFNFSEVTCISLFCSVCPERTHGGGNCMVGKRCEVGKKVSSPVTRKNTV